MIDVERLTQEANELAPLPASTVRLAQLIASQDYHLEDVADLIAFDQALTLKLLRAANSVAHAGATPVGTAQEAVLRLGAAQVLSLAVAASAKPFLQTRVGAYGLEENDLWRHSVAAAVAAETAQTFSRVEIPPETFTAALLHDVGKLIMGRFLGPEILASLRRAQEIDHLEQMEAESALLHIHHGELGGRIAQHWQLPPRVVKGITYHHNPGPGKDIVCDLTYVANLMAKRIQADLQHRKFELCLSPEVRERLDLTPKMADNFCRIAATRYAEVSRRYDAL